MHNYFTRNMTLVCGNSFSWRDLSFSLCEKEYNLFRRCCPRGIVCATREDHLAFLNARSSRVLGEMHKRGDADGGTRSPYMSVYNKYGEPCGKPVFVFRVYTTRPLSIPFSPLPFPIVASDLCLGASLEESQSNLHYSYISSFTSIASGAIPQSKKLAS